MTIDHCIFLKMTTDQTMVIFGAQCPSLFTSNTAISNQQSLWLTFFILLHSIPQFYKINSLPQSHMLLFIIRHTIKYVLIENAKIMSLSQQSFPKDLWQKITFTVITWGIKESWMTEILNVQWTKTRDKIKKFLIELDRRPKNELLTRHRWSHLVLFSE